MKKFILVGFQENPTQEPKILKDFQNGNSNGNGIFGFAGNSPAAGAVAAMAGFTSSNFKLSYSEGLEGALVFKSENEAGLVQQVLNRSFHGRCNCWCVRELKSETTVNDLVKSYLKANSHIYKYKKALEEMS